MTSGSNTSAWERLTHQDTQPDSTMSGISAAVKFKKSARKRVGSDPIHPAHTASHIGEVLARESKNDESSPSSTAAKRARRSPKLRTA